MKTIICGMLLAGSVIGCISCARQQQYPQVVYAQPLADRFVIWQGNSILENYMRRSGSIVCFVQCEPMSDDPGTPEANTLGIVGTESPYRKRTIKTYGDHEQLQQIMERLYAPDIRQRQNIETGRCLLAVAVSHDLLPQPFIQIPFELGEDGYAVTPLGKDRKLYEILKGGLDEWHAVLATERERERAQGLLWEYIHFVEKSRRESLSEEEYITKMNDPLPLSTEEFKVFLAKKQEDVESIISTLHTYYRNPNLIEEWYKKRDFPRSRMEKGIEAMCSEYKTSDPNICAPIPPGGEF